MKRKRFVKLLMGWPGYSRDLANWVAALARTEDGYEKTWRSIESSIDALETLTKNSKNGWWNL